MNYVHHVVPEAVVVREGWIAQRLVKSEAQGWKEGFIGFRGRFHGVDFLVLDAVPLHLFL
jgi:hypothetical protein